MKSIPAGARDFDTLPDSAFIGTAALCVMTNKSRTTLWRWERAGLLPKSRKLGGGRRLYRVGDIRALLAGE